MDIARELLSVILNEEIVSLEVKPQERTSEVPFDKIRILRFDFKAVIKTREGELKNVLMELQKAKQSFEIARFRKYLAQNYASEETLMNEKGVSEKWILPIVTIYFLGFKLDNVENAAFKINREYVDIITGDTIHKKEDFAEFLTHDCYIIQLAELEKEKRNKLEGVLQIFNQDYRLANEHFLNFEDDDSDALINKMKNRLLRAAADDEMRYQMDFEDEYERVTIRNRKADEKKIASLELDLETERKNAETERKNAETEREKNEELLRRIAELEKQVKK